MMKKNFLWMALLACLFLSVEGRATLFTRFSCVKEPVYLEALASFSAKEIKNCLEAGYKEAHTSGSQMSKGLELTKTKYAPFFRVALYLRETALMKEVNSHFVHTDTTFLHSKNNTLLMIEMGKQPPEKIANLLNLAAKGTNPRLFSDAVSAVLGRDVYNDLLSYDKTWASYEGTVSALKEVDALYASKRAVLRSIIKKIKALKGESQQDNKVAAPQGAIEALREEVKTLKGVLVSLQGKRTELIKKSVSLEETLNHIWEKRMGTIKTTAKQHAIDPVTGLPLDATPSVAVHEGVEEESLREPASSMPMATLTDIDESEHHLERDKHIALQHQAPKRTARHVHFATESETATYDLTRQEKEWKKEGGARVPSTAEHDTIQQFFAEAGYLEEKARAIREEIATSSKGKEKVATGSSFEDQLKAAVKHHQLTTQQIKRLDYAEALDRHAIALRQQAEKCRAHGECTKPKLLAREEKSLEHEAQKVGEHLEIPAVLEAHPPHEEESVSHEAPALRHEGDTGRSALLGSIQEFQKGSLRPVEKKERVKAPSLPRDQVLAGVRERPTLRHVPSAQAGGKKPKQLHDTSAASKFLGSRAEIMLQAAQRQVAAEKARKAAAGEGDDDDTDWEVT